MKFGNIMWVWTHNRRVKLCLKILSRWGKIFRKSQGCTIFDSHRTMPAQIREISRLVAWSVDMNQQCWEWGGATLLGRPLQLTVAELDINRLVGGTIVVVCVCDVCAADLVCTRFHTQLHGDACSLQLVCLRITVSTTQPPQWGRFLLYNLYKVIVQWLQDIC